MFLATIAITIDTHSPDEATEIAQHMLRIKRASEPWSINGVSLHAVSVSAPTMCRPDISSEHLTPSALADARVLLREMVLECDNEEISPYVRASITSVLDALDARDNNRNAWSSQHSAMADKHAKAVREHIAVISAEQSSTSDDDVDR